MSNPLQAVAGELDFGDGLEARPDRSSSDGRPSQLLPVVRRHPETGVPTEDYLRSTFLPHHLENDSHSGEVARVPSCHCKRVTGLVRVGVLYGPRLGAWNLGNGMVARDDVARAPPSKARTLKGARPTPAGETRTGRLSLTQSGDVQGTSTKDWSGNFQAVCVAKSSGQRGAAADIEGHPRPPNSASRDD
jgi:hypothetical protein